MKRAICVLVNRLCRSQVTDRSSSYRWQYPYSPHISQDSM